MMKTVDAVTLKQAFLNGARNLEVKKAVSYTHLDVYKRQVIV